MPTVTVTQHQSAYLARTARSLSSLLGRKVSKRDVLHVLIDLAVEDEGVYDPQTSEPMDPLRKRICQAEKIARATSFDTAALLKAVAIEPRS